MVDITPEQGPFLLPTFFLGSLKNESRTTKKILDAVQQDKVNYQPDACAKTANELLRHIAVADNMFLVTVINGVFNPSAVAIPENVKTSLEVATWYEQTYARNFEALTKLTGEQLVKIVDFRGLIHHPAVLFLHFALLPPPHHPAHLPTYLPPPPTQLPP